MDKDLRRAIDILIDVLTTLEPRVKGLSSWILETCETTDLWCKSEGNQGIKRMKEILHKGLLSILGEKLDQPLAFVKADASGLPVLVKPFVVKIKSYAPDPRLLSAAVTIARLPDLWLGRQDPASITKILETISESKIPGTARAVIEDFSKFVSLFFKQFPDHPLSKAWKGAIPLSDDHKYLYRESQGPNGYLIGNAHLDLISLERSKCASGGTLLNAIHSLQSCVAQSVKSETGMSWGVSTRLYDAFQESGGFPEAMLLKASDCPGKLSIKNEKGGKVRLVAMPDYFSQTAMRPIHDWLMKCLRAISSDCTFDQRRALPLIGKWQELGYELYSFDQSSCTDLFPFEFQLELIRERFGIPMMESIHTVMADREWSLTLKDGTIKKVRWQVGQPLGMFGSWPLMALSHHLLVQYCFYLSNGKRFSREPFKRYVICGDDIVIADRKLSLRYRKVCSLLGMRINEAKSHISGGSTGVEPVSEFAKILIWRGRPLFPIRPNLVRKAASDVRYAIPLIVDLISSDTWSVKLHTVERMIRKHFPKEKRYLTSLLTIPREFGGLGFRDDRSIRSHLADEFDASAVHPLVFYLAKRIEKALKLEQLRLKAEMSSMESINEIPQAAWVEHPLICYQRETTLASAQYQMATDMVVPSAKRIYAVLVVHGMSGFERFLNSDVIPGFPVKGNQPSYRKEWRGTLTEDEAIGLKRLTWFSVLRKKYSIPVLPPDIKARAFSPGLCHYLDDMYESAIRRLSEMPPEEHLRLVELVVNRVLEESKSSE